MQPKQAIRPASRRAYQGDPGRNGRTCRSINSWVNWFPK